MFEGEGCGLGRILASAFDGGDDDSAKDKTYDGKEAFVVTAYSAVEEARYSKDTTIENEESVDGDGKTEAADKRLQRS